MNRVVISSICVLALGGTPLAATAQTVPNPDRPFQAGYDATIWVDPDGCQHWVMDTGNEGFMSPRLDSRGMPVCGPVVGCGTIDADLLFAVDSAVLTGTLRSRLASFFAQEAAGGTVFVIRGHTDSTWTEEYNMGLSQRRADAVAAVARQAGAEVTTEAFGETQPVASNDTPAGRQQNRRVEIVCK
jgi:outer membrane protein OmpA-like peptidoglycan-associated protein